MPISSPFLSLEVKSNDEANVWIWVLIGALRNKAEHWTLKIVRDDGEELSFECSPPLSNEEVSNVSVRGRPRVQLTVGTAGGREEP